MIKPFLMNKALLLTALTVITSIAAIEPVRSSTVVVSFNATMPTTDIITSFSTGTASGYVWKNDTSATPVRRDVGQSFYTATDFTLESFGIQLSGNIQSGDAGGVFTVSIYQSTSASSIGSVIETQTGTFPTLSGGSGQYLNFDLTDYSLQGGYYYTVMLSWDVAANKRNLVFNAASAGGYSGGNVWAYDGTTYSAQGSDFYFYVQGEAVPEPHSVLLISMAGSMVLVGIHLRKRIS